MADITAIDSTMAGESYIAVSVVTALRCQRTRSEWMWRRRLRGWYPRFHLFRTVIIQF